MILSAQQKEIIEELTPIARIATNGSRERFTHIVLPRCSSLIAGPSGGGKTFVARQIAKTLGLPCLYINVSTWILMASRSEPWTWTTIAEWLETLDGGGVIILDEIEKLGGGKNGAGSEYSGFLRLEIFSLMDGSIPAAIKVNDPWEPSEKPSFRESQTTRKYLENLLQTRVMIIGCGAWQEEWQSNSKTLGFTTGPISPKPEPPSRSQILNSIQPELRQRFRNEISFLRPMVKTEYEAVAEAICRQLPSNYRQEWRSQVDDAILEASENNLGMRAFEELILRVMIMSDPEQDTPVVHPRNHSMRLI
jgi:hypothetical protein